MGNENATQEPQPITWDELKTFVNSLSEEQLKNKIPVLFQDETAARYLLEPFKMENDIYAHIDDDENAGTIEELKQCCKDQGEPFNENEYYICTKKGTPFLWLE